MQSLELKLYHFTPLVLSVQCGVQSYMKFGAPLIYTSPPPSTLVITCQVLPRQGDHCIETILTLPLVEVDKVDTLVQMK